MLILTALYVLGLVLLFLTNQKKSMLRYYPPAKLFSSMLFIAIAISCASYSGNWGLFMLLLPALILCLLGDVSLAFYKKNSNRYYLLAGMFFFLLAHFAFVYSLSKIQPFTWTDFIFPVFITLLTAIINRSPYINVGKLKPATLIYAFAVAAFCWKGLHIMITIPSTSTILLGSGALAFFISDTMLYFCFFCKKNFKGQGGIALLLYYMAIMAIALSIRF